MAAGLSEVYRRTRKPKDLLWNRFVARPLAALVLVPLQRTSITPNQVTLATLFVFAGSAAIIAFLPGWRALLLGVAALEFAYVLDCVDGQLARLRGTSTPIGAHLDFLMDELKAFLLVAAIGVRLWRADGQDRWLLEALGALVAVASAISLTTFLRRPEYAAATGAIVDKGLGDYDPGKAGAASVPGADDAAPPPAGDEATASAPPPSPAPAPRARPTWASPKGAIEALGRLIVHYPSTIVFVALADRLDVFLHAYFIVNAAHVARSLLGITLKLGRKTS